MKQKLPIFFILIVFFACGQKPNSGLSDRKEKIEEMESNEGTQDQADRKAKSIAYCKSHGVPTIDNLPFIESEAEVEIRTKDDVINRALALCYLGIKSEGLEKKHLDEFEKKYQLTEYFTANEKLYVNAITPTDQQQTDANWRYESLHVLLWALGYIDSLQYPGEMCNVADDVKLIFSKTKEEFSAKANLRSKSEILDQADLIYRIHWACVDAQVKNENPPAELNSSVVYERHYVLNWLIRYMDQAWDDVSTDT